MSALGGLEHAQLALCAGLAARGHELCLAYVNDGELRPRWASFASSITKVDGLTPERRRPISSSARVGAAVVQGRRQRPDIVYIHRHWDALVALGTAGGGRCPTISHLHVAPPSHPPRWMRPALSRAVRHVAVSIDTAERWSAAGLRRDRIDVAHNGVDLQHFRPGSGEERCAIRRQLGLPEGALVVTYLGRVEPAKGIHVLLAAAQLVKQRWPVCVVVAGPASHLIPADESRSYERSLRSAAAGLDVHWLPAVADPAELYRASDVVVVPSIGLEGFALVPLESLASGVPVIVSRTGGLPEALGQEFTEWVVEVGDAGALASTLDEVLGGAGDQGVRARCRSYAERTFSWDRAVQAVEGVMLDSLDRSGRARWPRARPRHRSARSSGGQGW